jgi:hypothetical protein
VAFSSSWLYASRTVTNAILSGTYTNFAHYAGLSAGWRWGGHQASRREGTTSPAR